MIKILYISACDMTRGGVQKCIQSWVEHMEHRERFDITWYCPGILESQEYFEEFKALGIHLVLGNITAPIKIRSPQYLKHIKTLMRENRYDIVHINTSAILGTFLTIKEAKKAGIPTIIAHSHSAPQIKKKLKKALAYIIRKGNAHYADYCLSCSLEAGDYLVGKKARAEGKVILIRNGIDYEKYRYQKDRAVALRERTGCADKVVFGQVGRLSLEKNPFFLLDVFAEIHRKREDTCLWMIGGGSLRNAIEQRISELGLEGAVMLWGERRDIYDLMQGMDVFLFPSTYEGLGIVAIEAQASGLPVYASDVVPREVSVTDLVVFLSLSDGAKAWADRILKDMDALPQRTDHTAEIKDAGYDVKDSTAVLESLYMGAVKHEAQG